MVGVKDTLLAKIDTKKREQILNFYKESQQISKDQKYKTTDFTQRSEGQILEYFIDNVIDFLETNKKIQANHPNGGVAVKTWSDGKINLDDIIKGLENLSPKAVRYVQDTLRMADMMQ